MVCPVRAESQPQLRLCGARVSVSMAITGGGESRGLEAMVKALEMQRDCHHRGVKISNDGRVKIITGKARPELEVFGAPLCRHFRRLSPYLP